MFLGSSEDVQASADLAVAAYAGNSVALLTELNDLGWQALGAAELGLSGSLFGVGLFDSNYLYDNLNAQGFVARKGNQLVISFAGTTIPDIFTDALGGAKSFYFHYVRYLPLIEAAKLYAVQNGINDILVTGHSLGGAVAEIFMHEHLGDTRFTGVTFGSPGELTLAENVYVDDRLLSLGHTGDPVVDSASIYGHGIDSRVDLPDSADYSLVEVISSSIIRDIGEHSLSSYNQTAWALTSSGGWGAYIANPGAFSIVLDQVSNFLQGSAHGDFILGVSGIDIIKGNGGADILDGGTNDDRITGGAGDDRIFGGIGSDTAYFGLAVGQYVISQIDNYVQIQAQSGDEGTDKVFEVENFVFNGKLYTREALIQTAAGTTTAPSTTYGDTPGGGSFSTAVDDIPDTTRSTAFMVAGSSLTTGIPFVNAIETAGDKDYVRIYLAQGVTYRFLVEGEAANGFSALADTFFRIRDGRDLSILNPAALAPTNLNAHDQAVGTNAQINFVAPYSGLYFVSVGAGGANFETLTGGYRLTANIVSVPASAPVNRNPIANADEYEANYGQRISGNLLANDTDADGNVLGAVAVSSFQTVQGGTVDILANGAFQYTAPSSGAGGTDSFTYSVRDGAGGVSTGTATITLLAPQPVGPVFSNGSDVATIPANSSGPYYALDGHDVLTGSPGEGRVVFGGDGNDVFNAGGALSYLIGGPGDDWFVAAQNPDNFFGDELGTLYGGNDTADFSSAGASVVVNLPNGSATINGQTWLISGIENIIGGSFSDNLTGYIGHERLVGGGGSDTILGDSGIAGLGGSDDIYGGSGNDVLSGGPGDDNIFGGDDTDEVRGGAGRDYLEGGAGDDTVYGGQENDTLGGNEGDDGVFGEEGDDYILASAGTDRLAGGDGNDTVDFSEAPTGLIGGVSGVSPLTATGWGGSTLEFIETLIASAFADNFSADGTNTLTSLTHVYLGDGNDRLTGFNLALIDGGNDDDVILANMVGEARGGNGDDQIFVLGGDIVLHGNGGNDGLFGNSGADQLEGNDGDDLLLGNGGEDILIGGFGTDNLQGGDDNDALWGEHGNDTLDGGNGNDFVLYYDASARVIVDLATNLSQGGDGTDTLISIEGVAGSAFGDILRGNQLANNLLGEGGDDQLFGAAGRDILDGSTGADTLDGGTGADTMRGGDGSDSYTVDDLGDIVFEVSAVLSTGGNDLVKSFVNFNLSSAGATERLSLFGTAVAGTGNSLSNMMYGNSTGNVLSGLGGNDTISGLNGNDIINGGLGNDRLTGGLNNDFFVFNTKLSSTLNRDTITDFNVVNDTIRLENTGIFSNLGSTLGTLSAAKFWKSATGLAHDADDRIIYNTTTGVLTYDSNGSAAGGGVQFAVLTNKAALTHLDFFVI